MTSDQFVEKIIRAYMIVGIAIVIIVIPMFLGLLVCDFLYSPQEVIVKSLIK